MVLFKRKPVQYVESPPIEDYNQEVWVIDATGEIFVEYTEYLRRLEFYKHKRFICEITGHSGLDFFEALESEIAGSKNVEEQFPDPLMGPILRKVQFQTISRVDTLVDVLFDYFKDDFYPGEMVIASFDNGDKSECLIREKVAFPEQRDANGKVVKPAYANYMVKLVNRDGSEMALDGSKLARDRKIFTKAMLRAFIKNTVYREAWNGAPWLVKEAYAKKYHIDQNIPKHLQRGETAAERKAVLALRKEQAKTGVSLQTNGYGPGAVVPVIPKAEPKENKASPGGNKSQKSKPQTPSSDNRGKQTLIIGMNGLMKIQPRSAEPIRKESPKPLPVVVKYPIEDLQVMPVKDSKARPALNFVSKVSATNGIREETVGLLLETWEFLNVYCEAFCLDSFTFDDYVDGLLFSSEDADCELIVEIHCALLKSFVDEGDNGKIKLTSLPDNTEEEEEEEEEGGDEDEEMADGGEENSGEVKEEADDGDHKMSDDAEEEAKANTSRVEEPKHCAAEMDAVLPWIDRLRKRDFKEGGWEAILVGLFNQVSSLSRFTPLCEEILPHLAPFGSEPIPETAKEQYRSLDVNLRIRIVQALQQLTYDTPVVRTYMEECSEAMTKLRKEKIEHQKTRKQLLEELKQHEEERKILLPENTPKSPSPEPGSKPGTPALDDDGDVTMNGRGTSADEDSIRTDDDDGENPVSRSRSLRRGEDRLLERKRKREMEKEKAEAAAKVPKTAAKFRKVLAQIEKTKEAIKEEEDDIATIDIDLREADCARLRLLGRDRFWNRYWFFERNGMPYGGLPESSTADSGYAMGRIWLQGPSDSEIQGFLQVEDVIRNDTDGEDKVAISVKERRSREEGENKLNGPNCWGFYETVEDLDELLKWLDSKGEREFKLKKEIELFKSKIADSMKARNDYLQKFEEKITSDKGSRMSTRGKNYFDPGLYRCLRWQNNMALEELGHTHFDHPKAKAKANKKGNKDGKSLGRQGTRYTF